MSWRALWALVLWASVASFALVSALVALGGWREVRALFRALDDAERRKTHEPR